VVGHGGHMVGQEVTRGGDPGWWHPRTRGGTGDDMGWGHRVGTRGGGTPEHVVGQEVTRGGGTPEHVVGRHGGPRSRVVGHGATRWDRR